MWERFTSFDRGGCRSQLPTATGKQRIGEKLFAVLGGSTATRAEAERRKARHGGGGGEGDERAALHPQAHTAAGVGAAVPAPLALAREVAAAPLADAPDAEGAGIGAAVAAPLPLAHEVAAAPLADVPDAEDERAALHPRHAAAAGVCAAVPAPLPLSHEVSAAPFRDATDAAVRATPLASPMRRAIVNMRAYLEDIGHLTKLDPHDAWLPITESRNGNAYYSAFHTLSSGIGFQALVLPLAFTFLGWYDMGNSVLVRGICLAALHALVARPTPRIGPRNSLQQIHALGGSRLRCEAGEMAGPVSHLVSVGWDMHCHHNRGRGRHEALLPDRLRRNVRFKPLTAAEWYLVFTCLAVVLSQLPNLNSIAGISLIGSVTAVTYCTLIWVISVSKGRLPGVSYHPVEAKSDVDRVLGILNALGIISFAFRGHNLVLEIQATMPSSLKHPSRVPMWRGEGSIPADSILLVPHSNLWFLGLRQHGKSRRNT
ncbi:Lysine histidine [Musa troglodytarum]|uniref:Lysine histidine n=1 Tax=Musa troglodytarum TaxID=320322 RepID=A0A9E7GA77_9LILI|nr:Lysine histidine [Musa troglodytarum]